MAALLHIDVFRRLTLSPESVAQMIGATLSPTRPTASLGANGHPICAWTIDELEVRGRPPS